MGTPPLADAVAGALGDPDGVRLVQAPGRVNLIGDHTDYTGGWCLPVAIDRRCVVAVRPEADPRLRARSLDLAGSLDVDPGADPETVEPSWARFVVAAARGVRRAAPGGTVVVGSDVPLGAGLSSSAALSVALVLALAAEAPAPLALARAARDAEARATGVPVGLLDQMASVYGEAGAALLLDCDRLEVEPVPIPATLGIGVVHSGVTRTLAGSAYAERRAACEAAATRLGLRSLRDASLDVVADDPRARHVVSENGRVRAAADALRAGDLRAVGTLALASHASLRDDFEVSTPELDLLVELLVAEGALGARLTGAGFGGSVVAFAADSTIDAVLARAVDHYREQTDRPAAHFRVRPSGGAGPILR